MEFKTILEKRRSTRKFLPRKVEHDKLQRIVDMALQAPSSRNCRSTRFLVVRKPEIVHRMAGMRDYGAAPLAAAPAAIVVMGDRAASDLWVDNAAIAATMLQLALVDAGLKSCWVHVNGRPCRKDAPEAGLAVDFLREFLPLPDSFGVLCVIALGYSDFEPKPLPEESVDRVKWME